MAAEEPLLIEPYFGNLKKSIATRDGYAKFPFGSLTIDKWK